MIFQDAHMLLAQWQISASRCWPEAGYIQMRERGNIPSHYETSFSEGSYVRVSGVQEICSGAIFAFKQCSVLLDEQHNNDTRQYLCSEAER